MILGLTGPFGSGCTTAAAFMQADQDFAMVSLSQVIRRELEAEKGQGYLEGLPFTGQRQAMQVKGDEIRASQLNGVAKLAEPLVAAERGCGKDVVIDGIRNPAEIEEFRRVFGSDFYLFSIGASRKTRWQRCAEAYENDKETFDRDDDRDSGKGQPAYGQRVSDCVELADIAISNDRDYSDAEDWALFQSKLCDYVELVKCPRYRVPYPDEVYMAMSYMVSLRSSCTRRHVGALIVTSDSQSEGIVSSGFNEVPRGMRTCQELGGTNDYCYMLEQKKTRLRKMLYCPKCGAATKVPADDELETPWQCSCGARLPDDFMTGKGLDMCLALHAEEDAILQAARLGSTTLENHTLYTRTFPCNLCAKMIADVRIKSVVYREPYPMVESHFILEGAGVETRQYEGVNPAAFCRLFDPFAA